MNAGALQPLQAEKTTSWHKNKIRSTPWLKVVKLGLPPPVLRSSKRTSRRLSYAASEQLQQPY